MKASEWLKGATLVRHGNRFAKRTLTTLAMACALASPMAAQADNITPSNGYDKVGAHSQLLTDWARQVNQDVLVISAEDASSISAVQALSTEFLASRESLGSQHSASHSDFPPLANLKGAQAILESRLGAVAGRIDRDSGRVCVMNGKVTYATKGINDPSILIGDSTQEQAWMMMHELAHCMSSISPDHPMFGSLETDEERKFASSLYEESIADIAAAVYVASHTGNWNFATNGLIAHRIAEPQDVIHNSLPMLDILVYSNDPSSFAPMTPPEAFSAAMDFMCQLKPEHMLLRAELLSGAQMSYAKALNEVVTAPQPAPASVNNLAGHRFKILAGYGLYQDDLNRVDGLVALKQAVNEHVARFVDPKANALKAALDSNNAQNVLDVFEKEYGADMSRHTDAAAIDAQKIKSAMTQLGLAQNQNPFSGTQGKASRPAAPSQDGPQI